MLTDGVVVLQELYRWPEVAQAARYALGIRYSLLPYLYTSFRNTASHGCPLARAVMLGWPWDPLAKGVDRQWTMGDAVLITPVMEQAAPCFSELFPSTVAAVVTSGWSLCQCQQWEMPCLSLLSWRRCTTAPS